MDLDDIGLVPLEIRISRVLNRWYDHDPEVFGSAVAGVVFLGLLIAGEVQHSRTGIPQIFLSALILYSGYMHSTRPTASDDTLFVSFMLFGLICCSIRYISSVNSMFRRTLCLLGNISYTYAFHSLIASPVYDKNLLRQSFLLFGPNMIALCILLFALMTFFYFRQYLKKRKVLLPGMIYTFCIAGMVISSSYVYFDWFYFKKEGRVIILTAALLIYISEIFDAHNELASHHVIKRSIGWTFFYISQFLLTVSMSHIHRHRI